MNFKHQDPAFYSRLFDNYEEGPSEEWTASMKVFIIIYPGFGDPKLYVFQGGKSACVLRSFSYGLLFVGNKVAVDWFKYYIIPSLKANTRLKFAQDASFILIKEKLKPIYKLAYALFEGKYGYDPFLDISPFPTLIYLIYFLGDIHHFVTVASKFFKKEI